MIIGIDGYGCTGASAFRDLIKECAGVSVFPYEFQLLQQPDGILDLYNDIVISKRRVKINSDIVRFKRNIKSDQSMLIRKATNDAFIQLSEEFINAIVQSQWKGHSIADPIDIYKTPNRFRKTSDRIIKKMGRLVDPTFVWPKPQTRYFSSMSSTEFVTITQKYLYTLLEASGLDTSNIIVLEQAFGVGNPKESMIFFENPYSLIVDRDPRDVYIFTNVLFQYKAQYIPHNRDVKAFINYYLGLHGNTLENNRIRRFRFEDLLYQYEKTVEDVMTWLGLKHINKRKYFVPEKSINNTEIFKNYPEVKRDIECIESELQEYLYDFEHFKHNISIKREDIDPFDIE